MSLIISAGEDVFVTLYGAAQDSNVRLDKNSMRVEKHVHLHGQSENSYH